MNILSISDGSERSTHAYLPYMAEAAGQEMLLCDLCIDGCSLEQHWDNWRKELPCYEYDICLPGETDTRTVDEVALHEAVEDEEWDVITLRQSRSMSGVEESYLPYLAELAEYCRMMQPKAKIMLIQPWTYDSDSADPSFRRLYGGDQDEMYRALTESCAKAAIESDIDIIVPIGKAFQIARQTPATATTATSSAATSPAPASMKRRSAKASPRTASPSLPRSTRQCRCLNSAPKWQPKKA